MTQSKTYPLHRLLERREAMQLLEEFASIVPGVDLALIRLDGRLFLSLGEWSQEELQEAESKLKEIGGNGQEATDSTTEAGAILLWEDRMRLHPLMVGTHLVGALVARGPNPIDSQQGRTLHCLHQVLSTLVTRGVEKRALAHETLERYREINLLHSLGETIISCLDAQVLPERIMQEGSRIIRSDAGAVFMVDPGSGEVELRASYNLVPVDSARSDELAPVQLAHAAACRVVAEGIAYIDNKPLSPFASPSEEEKEAKPWVRALLGAPLKTRDRVLGAIVLLRRDEKGMFTAGEEKLLNALATQTAIALENARLYSLVGQALARREGQLSTIEEIARELNATLNLEHVLDLVVRRCLEATGAERGAIILIEDEYEDTAAPSSSLQVVSARGFRGELPPHLQQLVRQAIATGQATRQLESPQPAAELHLAVPILLEDHPLGAILLASSLGPSNQSMGPQDEAFIGSLAVHAATAIHNARLYEAEQEAYLEAEQERSKLATILTGTSEAIIVIDERQHVLLLNPAAQVFFSTPPSEVVDRPLGQITAEIGLISLFERAISGGRALTGEVTGPGNTTFYAGISRVPNVGWVAVLQDISYLKELDTLKSEFVSTASHDLKNPIGVVMGYAGLIAEVGELNEMQQQCLDQIMRTSRNMTRLINDLLDIVRIEAGFLGQMEHCNVAAIVQEIVSQLRHQARAKKITLRERISRRVPPVMGNPHRLTQVVTNLVDNAIKYTPDGGRINVSVRSKRENVTIKVEDNGIGIAPKDLEHMFERFYRASTAEELGIEGSGLGLSICRSIAEKHGGRIWVDSKIGQGSTFYFTLPALEG